MTPDPVDIVALTRALVDIDSTTGRPFLNNIIPTSRNSRLANVALANKWFAAALLGAAAVLIKGPFGLLPLACVALAGLLLVPFARDKNSLRPEHDPQRGGYRLSERSCSNKDG